jgi:hypothetical protein
MDDLEATFASLFRASSVPAFDCVERVANVRNL